MMTKQPTRSPFTGIADYGKLIRLTASNNIVVGSFLGARRDYEVHYDNDRAVVCAGGCEFCGLRRRHHRVATNFHVDGGKMRVLDLPRRVLHTRALRDLEINDWVVQVARRGHGRGTRYSVRPLRPRTAHELSATASLKEHDLMSVYAARRWTP